MPQNVWNLVTKVLQKAAGRDIRLGFRVPYCTGVPSRSSATTFNGGDSSSNMLNKVWILQSMNHQCIKNLEDVLNRGWGAQN